MTSGPNANPVFSVEISFAFVAPAEVMISIGPNPMRKAASREFSDFIAPGSNVVPQALQPVHS